MLRHLLFKVPVHYSLACLALTFIIWPSSAFSVMDPNEIVAKADDIRVPKGSYKLKITVKNFDGDELDGINKYVVFSKDLDNSLVQFRAPATERGKSLLLIDDDVWIYLPRVKKPVRVPLKQRLFGKIAIGDMIRTQFSNDYDATLIGEEDFKGETAFVLDLKAKSSKKTYSRIKFWVAKKDFRPLLAEYFTASGKSIKTLTFEDFRFVEGKSRPMRGVFQDSIHKNKISHLDISKMTRKRLRDMMFTKQFMRTLE